MHASSRVGFPSCGYVCMLGVYAGKQLYEVPLLVNMVYGYLELPYTALCCRSAHVMCSSLRRLSGEVKRGVGCWCPVRSSPCLLLYALCILCAHATSRRVPWVLIRCRRAGAGVKVPQGAARLGESHTMHAHRPAVPSAPVPMSLHECHGSV